MKTIFQLIFFLIIISCSKEIENKEPIYFDINLTKDDLSFSTKGYDVLFHRGPYGLKDGKDFKIPLDINTNLTLKENSFKIETSINRVRRLNNQYDLLNGTIKSYINDQEVFRNDTIFNINGFFYETNGKYLLFDKINDKYIDISYSHFDENSYHSPFDLINDQVYFRRDDLSGINFIDLNDPTLTSHNLINSGNFSQFIFNSKFDMFLGWGAPNANRYIHHESNNLMELQTEGIGLARHFKAIDDNFYAYNYDGTLNNAYEIIYKINLSNNRVTTEKIYQLNENNDYPEFRLLGNIDWVIPNNINNTTIIISKNSHPNKIDFYEFDHLQKKIRPIVNFNFKLVQNVEAYKNLFFIVIDNDDLNNVQFRKFNFFDYSLNYSFLVGKGFYQDITLDKENGNIYFMFEDSTYNSTKFVTLNSNNQISTITLSVENDIRTTFSILN